jgi:tetratricopeptide (TPR) repeat protein
MSADSGSQAQIFVQHVDVPAPGTDAPGRRYIVFDAAVEQTFVVGSDIVAFVRGVPAEQRSDVVNALLLAQLVAKRKVPEPSKLADIVTWYDSYFDTLSNIGFSVQERSFTEYRAAGDTFEAQEAIRDAASVMLAGAPAALATVTKTLDSMKKGLESMTATSSSWVTLFSIESRSGTTGRFQVLVVDRNEDAGLVIRLMAFGMEGRSTMTQVLFFKFKKNDARVLHHSGTVIVNTFVLAGVRDAIVEKLKPYAGNLIAPLDEPPAQSPRDEWLRMAPGPRPLTEGQRWHVYVSYRSVNRQWVLQLYDILKTLGYTVFLDQLVLAPGANLARSLSEALDNSAAAVLVWSSESSAADWQEHEYNAFSMREHADRPFRFIVARLDRAPLPALLGSRLFVDFSESREAPSGTPLLQLLYGLRGEPLPPDAVKMAADIDAEIRSTRARIQAARSVGDADRLASLANSDSRVWHSSPVLLCQVAEALIALRQMDRALTVIEQCKRRFPKAVRPRQLHGLALARKGDWKEAQLVLEELYVSGERDTETLGILGRTWMDRYRATGDRASLQRSRDLYREAFEMAPDDSYVGINAASKSLLLGEVTVARDLAARVDRIVGSVPTGDYWKTVTAAEGKLILGEYRQAADLYRAGVQEAPLETGSHQATYHQAQFLLEHAQAPPAERDAILSAFADVVTPQNADADKPRSPLTAAERTAIANLLFHLVAARHAKPDLLTSLDPGRFWEAVRKARPRATREELASVAESIAGRGRPGPLWLAWIQTVRARDLERLVE